MSEKVDGKADGSPAGGAGATGEIERLVNALRFEKAKNEVLLGEVVALEDAVVNRCMADFDAVVSDETREFWRQQLLTNREAATTALTELANAKKVAAPAAPAARAPMHNRATARPVAPAVVGGGGTDVDADGKAAKIRNRAHEICGAERVPFSAAFRRAELEIGGQ
jgi:hypothetical protein